MIFQKQLLIYGIKTNHFLLTNITLPHADLIEINLLTFFNQNCITDSPEIIITDDRCTTLHFKIG